jgi:hypothetical protein
MSTRHSLSRREFLGLSGLIVSFALSPALAPAEGSVHPQLAQKSVAPNEVDGFLAIESFSPAKWIWVRACARRSHRSWPRSSMYPWRGSM